MQVNVILLRGNLDHGQVWIVAVFELKCPNHEEAKEESHGQAGHDCTDWCLELVPAMEFESRRLAIVLL